MIADIDRYPTKKSPVRHHTGRGFDYAITNMQGN